MVTVPGIYLDGSREPINMFIFVDPTKEIPDHDNWCYWRSLINESYDTAATYDSTRIQLAELIYPCNTFEEALACFPDNFPEYFI